MRLERDLGVPHDLVDQLRGQARIEPPALVDGRELPTLGLGRPAERLPLDVELALEELALGLHREVLAGGHRERPGDQPGEPGQPDDRPARMGAGDAEDQRDVRDETVAHPEDRGPGAAGADVAVVVDVGPLRLDRTVRHAPERSDPRPPL